MCVCVFLCLCAVLSVMMACCCTVWTVYISLPAEESVGCTPVNKILFWALYFLAGVYGNYLEYWKGIAPSGMNEYSVELQWTDHFIHVNNLPCLLSVLTFGSCTLALWGNEYTDPVTPVNTLFTKCVHIILTFIYMYPEGINTQTQSLLWTPCSQSAFTLFWHLYTCTLRE